MFSLHDFVMSTLRGMVDHEPDYKVRQYALGWYDKAQLTETDMDELSIALTPPVSVGELADTIDTMLNGDANDETAEA